MSTAFPTSVDAFTRPNAGDPRNSPSLAGVIDNAFDAVEAVETKVGTTAQTGTDKRLIYYSAANGRFTQSANLAYNSSTNELELGAATKISWGVAELYSDGAGILTDQALTVGGFLSGSTPMCRVSKSTDTTFADNTETTLTFNTEDFDTDTMHSTSSNTSRITFNTAGKYMFGFSCNFQGDNIEYTQASIRLNGTTTVLAHRDVVGSGAFDIGYTAISSLREFSAADYIEVRVNGSSNQLNTITIGGGLQYSPQFWAIKVAD